MKTIICFFLFVPLLYGCTKIGCRPEKHAYTFRSNQQIDTTRSLQSDTSFEFYQYQLTEGNRTVFQYRYDFRDCPQIADDEGSRIILLEVPAGINNFRFEDSAQLKAAKTLLVLHCECYPYLPVFFKEGWIEGRRISNNKWRLSAELKAPGRSGETIRFAHDFLAN